MTLEPLAPRVPDSERILVCVSTGTSGAALIRAGGRLAQQLSAPWSVIHVSPAAGWDKNHHGRIAVAQHLRLAELLGAEIIEIQAASTVQGIGDAVRSRGFTRIVLGITRRRRFIDWLNAGLSERLRRRLPEVRLVHPLPAEVPLPKRHPLGLWGASWRDYLKALHWVAIVTAALYPLQTAISQYNIAIIYLITVVMVAIRGQIGPSVLAAAVGMLALDYLFVNPVFSVSISQTEYILVFAAILGIGILISTLTQRLRRQADTSVSRESRTAALHALSRDLAVASDRAAILAATVRQAEVAFTCPSAVLLPENGVLMCRAGASARVTPELLMIATRTLASGRPTGPASPARLRSGALLWPLNGTHGSLGVLVLFPQDAASDQAEDHEQFESFSHLVALALGREQLARQAQSAQVEAEGERLRSGLLASVSHDLRTPLAAITGAATTLAEHGEQLTPEARQDLARTIAEESEQLASQVLNLLDMTRLEGGALRPRLEPWPVEELIGTALSSLERALRGRPLTVTIEPGLPPVAADGTQMQRVLVNLLENALKYAPSELPLTIEAHRAGDQARISIADRGPGVLASEREHVFVKFWRGPGVTAHGSGLGLAICKTIIDAHGGAIGVEDHAPGARFWFTLPLDPRGLPTEMSV